MSSGATLENGELKPKIESETPHPTLSPFKILFTTTLSLTRPMSVLVCLKVVIEYFFAREGGNGIATLLCPAAAALVTIPMKLRMHRNDVEMGRVLKRQWYYNLVWVVLMPFFLRNFHLIYYIYKLKRAEKQGDYLHQRSYYRKYLREVADVALISVFDTFLNSAPQKVVQLTIFLNDELDLTRRLLICVDLMTITYCIASYNGNIRRERSNKAQVTLLGLIFMFFWHVCIIISRILALSLIASGFPEWTIVAAVIHGLVMALWIHTLFRPGFCDGSSIGSPLFSLAMGFVYIFTFISTRDGRTRYYYSFFYTVCGLENLAAVILFWNFHNPLGKHAVFKQVFCWSSIGLFAVGLFFMAIYYCFFHPNVLAKQNERQQSDQSPESATEIQ